MEGGWFKTPVAYTSLKLFITDIRSMKIPNRLTLPVTVAGIGPHHMGKLGWFLFSAFTGCSGFGILFLMYAIGAVGQEMRIVWWDWRMDRTCFWHSCHYLLRFVRGRNWSGDTSIPQDSAKRIRGMAGSLAGFSCSVRSSW